ncbi:MAG: nitrous oxide-stimulated promoter family protein [Spirochaetales bacterium]
MMIDLYYRSHPDLAGEEKEGLIDYALNRLESCRFGEDKPTCSRCPVHCYRSDMRERIRAVMRYAGPRMLVYHPLLAILHLKDKLWYKAC